jgi:hypothetical protein
MLNSSVCWHDDVPAGRRNWRPVLTLLAIGLVAACSDTAGPPEPGDITVRTTTAGFMKAAGYELVVAGVNRGAVGATDEVTVSGLEPGSYEIELANMPANCSAAPVTVSVLPRETAQVAFDVTCAYDAAVAYSVQFTRQRPDLNTGLITVCPFGVCSSQEHWDIFFHNNVQTQPQAVMRHNQTSGVQVARLTGVTLAQLTEAHLNGATFGTQLLTEPFGDNVVILVRTDLGDVYALGDASENLTLGIVSFNAARVATP